MPLPHPCSPVPQVTNVRQPSPTVDLGYLQSGQWHARHGWWAKAPPPAAPCSCCSATCWSAPAITAPGLLDASGPPSPASCTPRQCRLVRQDLREGAGRGGAETDIVAVGGLGIAMRCSIPASPFVTSPTHAHPSHPPLAASGGGHADPDRPVGPEQEQHPVSMCACSSARARHGLSSRSRRSLALCRPASHSQTLAQPPPRETTAAADRT